MKLFFLLISYPLPFVFFSTSLATTLNNEVLTSIESALGVSAAQTLTKITTQSSHSTQAAALTTQKQSQSPQSTQAAPTTEDQSMSSSGQRIVTVTRTASSIETSSKATTSENPSSDQSSHLATETVTATTPPSTSKSSTASVNPDSTSALSSVQTIPANPIETLPANATTATSTDDSKNRVSAGGIAIGAILSAIIIAGIVFTIFKYSPDVRARYTTWRQGKHGDRIHLASDQGRDDGEASIVKGMGLGLGEITILKQNSDVNRFEDVEYHNPRSSEDQDDRRTPSSVALQETPVSDMFSPQSNSGTSSLRHPVPLATERADKSTYRTRSQHNTTPSSTPETPISYIEAKWKYMPYRPQGSLSPLTLPQAARRKSTQLPPPPPPPMSPGRFSPLSSSGRSKRVSRLGFQQVS